MEWKRGPLFMYVGTGIWRWDVLIIQLGRWPRVFIALDSEAIFSRYPRAFHDWHMYDGQFIYTYSLALHQVLRLC